MTTINADFSYIPESPKPITVGEVYGGDVTIPEGWEFVAFRIPVSKEWYITFDTKCPVQKVSDNEPLKKARIIIRHRMPRQFTFTETPLVECPKSGQWFINNVGDPQMAYHDFAVTKYPILKLAKTEVPS